MMSGQIQRSSSVVIGGNGSTSNNSLSISPTTALQSPLQIFVRAKKRINDIYGEVELYVNDSCKFLQCRETLWLFGILHMSKCFWLTRSST